MRQQTAPWRVFIDELVHVASRLVGQQINIQAMQLRFIDAGSQSVVVAGNQQVFAGFAFRQTCNVGGHGAESHFTGFATGDVEHTHDLVLGKLAVGVIGVPINTLYIQA